MFLGWGGLDWSGLGQDLQIARGLGLGPTI